MDPEACLQRLERSIAERDFAEAVMAVTDYYRWRVRGGFEPHNGDARAETLSANLADALET